MFTGIVEAAGTVESLDLTAEGGKLRVRVPFVAAGQGPRQGLDSPDAPPLRGFAASSGNTPDAMDVQGGATPGGAPAPPLQVSNSIAVNGCCLTVVELHDDVFTADLSGETLRRTCFGQIKPGRRVNLERPLRAGAELGGHFVQGHVDGVGRVVALRPEGPADAPKAWTYSVRVPAELHRYVAMKGSIALDGISLTVAGWHDGVVDIAIIPFTFEHTNLRDIALGDAVNIECDVLAKYVERLLAAREEAPASHLTVEKLIAQGF